MLFHDVKSIVEECKLFQVKLTDGDFVNAYRVQVLLQMFWDFTQVVIVLEYFHISKLKNN